MTRTASAAALLHAALQDIHAGKRDQVGRLPTAARDPELRDVFDAERASASKAAARLEAAGSNPAGPANLWMKGVLDDAARDADSTEPGRLLDIALAGAIRKGKAAESVACDTAIALAHAIGDDQLVDVARAIKEQAATAETAFLRVIERLAGASVAS